MPVTIFSKYKDPTKIPKVSRTRKVRHSFTNWVRGTKRGGAGNMVFEIGNQGAAVTGVVATVGSVLAAGAAGAAVAGAAFAVAMTGPVAGIILGCVGMALAAKAMYSDREAAHNKLMPYVWSLIDDQPPKQITDEGWKDAAGAALGLLQDGKHQLTLLESKYAEVKNAYDKWRDNLRNAMTEYETQTKAYRAFLQNIVLHSQQQELAARERAVRMWTQSEEGRESIELAEKSIRDDWASADSVGGAIYDYLRRLSHMSNYMMAGDIYNKFMLKRFGAQGGDISNNSSDPWANCDAVKKTRDALVIDANNWKKFEDMCEAFNQGAVRAERARVSNLIVDTQRRVLRPRPGARA